jgi:hypothetical protein
MGARHIGRVTGNANEIMMGLRESFEALPQDIVDGVDQLLHGAPPSAPVARHAWYAGSLDGSIAQHPI